MTLFERVREEISEQLGVQKDEIEMDSRLTELGADSLDRIAIVCDLEEEFEISIPTKDAQKLYTVRDVIRYIENEMEPA